MATRLSAAEKAEQAEQAVKAEQAERLAAAKARRQSIGTGSGSQLVVWLTDPASLDAGTLADQLDAVLDARVKQDTLPPEQMAATLNGLATVGTVTKRQVGNIKRVTSQRADALIAALDALAA